MNKLSKTEFERLVEGADILATNARGPNVFLTENDKVVKIFWQKGLFTSNRLSPYALRFKRNAEKLKQQGIPSITVEKVAKCGDMDMHFVVYPRLPGATIRELSNNPEQQANALEHLPEFMASLHRKGIFYKALHLGNVLVQPDQSFALIDIHATRFYNKAIPLKSRLRNFSNILNYAEDYALLEKSGFESFFNRYLEHSQLSSAHRDILINTLAKQHYAPGLKQALAQI